MLKNKNLLLFSLTSFFTDISSEMIIPLIPIALTLMGAPYFAIGILEGISEFIANILKLYSGYLSEKLDRKKLVIFGYSFSFFSKSLFPLSLFLRLPGFIYTGRILDRIGKGIRTSPRDAILADSLRDKDIGKGMGIHRSFDTIGALIGSLSAFLILFYYKDKIFYVFLVALLPAFLGILFLLFIEDLKSFKKHEKISFEIEDKKFYAALFLAGLTNFSVSFFILNLSKRGFSAKEIMFFYFIFNVFYAITSFISGILFDKATKKGYMFGLTFLFLLLAQLSGYFKPNILGVSSLILYGLFLGFYDVIFKSFIKNKKGKTGVKYGALNFAVGSSSFLSNISVGLFSSIIGIQKAFLAEFFVSLLLISLSSLIYRKKL